MRQQKFSLRIYRQGVLWVIVALFLRVVLGMAIHFYSVNAGYEGFFPHPIGSDDRAYWDDAVDIWRGHGLAVATNTYPFYLATVFKLTEPSLVAGKALNIILSSLTVYLGFLMAVELCRNLPIPLKSFRHPANLTALFMTFHPSVVFNCTQLLKDPLLLFFGMWSLYLALRMLQRGSLLCWLLFPLTLYCAYGLRPYAPFAIILSLFVYVFFMWRASFKVKLVIATVLVAFIGVVPNYFGTGWFGSSLIMYYIDMENLANFRETTYAAGGSTLGIKIDFSNPVGFLFTYGYSYLSAMYGPFPWQVETSLHLVAMVEAAAFWLLIPVWWRGIVHLRRERGLENFLLLFSIIIVAIIALFSDNLGSNVRLRSLPWYAFFIYAMVVMSRQRLKHAAALSSSRNRGNLPGMPTRRVPEPAGERL